MLKWLIENKGWTLFGKIDDIVPSGSTATGDNAFHPGQESDRDPLENEGNDHDSLDLQANQANNMVRFRVAP